MPCCVWHPASPACLGHLSSQHPLELIPSGDGAAFPHPMPCQHHPIHRTLQTFYKPKPPTNLVLGDGQWRQWGLGAACSIAAAPLPAQGLWGELSGIQQPTGGTWLCWEGEKQQLCPVQSLLLLASVGCLLRETTRPSQGF